jgi:hypothetical protein
MLQKLIELGTGLRATLQASFKTIKIKNMLIGSISQLIEMGRIVMIKRPG